MKNFEGMARPRIPRPVSKYYQRSKQINVEIVEKEKNSNSW